LTNASHNLHNNEPDDFSSVEAMLLAAGDFIEVDPYLRPSVIEEATASVACQRAWRRGGLLATAILCVAIPLAIVVPLWMAEPEAPRDLTQIAEPVLNVNSGDVELTAARLEPNDRIWGMVRVFQRLRTDRNRVFGPKR